jgi:hypothetical protein
MRVTKENVLVEYSAWRPFWGAYEQGAPHDRIVAYPVEDAKRVLGMTTHQLKKARWYDRAPGYACATISEVLYAHLGPGRVIRRGRKFE